MNSLDLKKFRRSLNCLFCTGMVLCASALTSGLRAETLPELNQSTAESRTYDFIAGENVTLDTNMGMTSPGSFTITGINKTTNSIVFNSFSGFVVTYPNTSLHISNLTLSDATSNSGSILNYTADNSYVHLKDLTIQNNTSISTGNAFGGAIYTSSDLTLSNTDLIGNSAITSGESTSAKGGAVYSTADLSIIADSDNLVIVDNYTQDSEGTTDNAIYMANPDSTLTITAKNKGNAYIDDDISGVDGYKAHLNGDKTGQIRVNNIENASKVATNDVTITFADGKTTSHKIDNLEIGENTNFVIDADLKNSKADTLTSENGTGEMKISEISINSLPSSNSATVQVLKDAGDITLNIDPLISGRDKKLVQSISTVMYNDNILANSITLATTSTPNDSIRITGAKDLLYEMAKYRGSTVLVFRTATPYILTKDLETTPQESSISIYNTSNADKGTINANGHSMFKLRSPISTVSLKDMQIENANSLGDGSVAYIENSTAYFNANGVTFKNNTSGGSGGAINTTLGNTDIKNSDFEGNSAAKKGGALYFAKQSSTAGGTDVSITLTNTNFKNNTAGEKGGAIYSEGELTVAASDGTSTFEGNSANGESNAIYIGNGGSLRLDAKNDGTINMNDKIDGTEFGYELKVTGDKTGNINLNESVSNANITHTGGKINMAQDNLLQGNNYFANGGTLNLINGTIGTTNFSSFSNKGTSYFSLDADLENVTMDRITADNYGPVSGKITINNFNLISDKDGTVKILFADSDIKNYVTTSVKKAYSKVYKYSVSYDKSTGYFTFKRGGDGPHPHPQPIDKYNPAILTGPVAQQAAYMNQLMNYEYATYHASTYMMLPKRVREGMYNRNADNSFDPENYAPTYVNIPEEVKSIWFRPYTSFESVPLKNGPKITSVSYGTLAGGDSDMIELKHGFKLVYGGYIGYNGNNFHYKGIHSVQQGGLFGGTVNIYKGNFFNTFTANVGWQINDSDTAYGSDFMNMFVTGFSNRLGYNIEAKGGKIIFQPSLTMGYTYVGSWWDYKASNGARMKPDGLNVMHFIPGFKIIGNLANGWQPYFVVNVVCNFGSSSHYTAENVTLPSMSIDPYVEYGLGIQKRWSDKYSGFVQATARSGGRRGGSLLLGFRYMLGQLAEKTANLLHPDPERRVAIFREKKDPNIVVENLVKRGVTTPQEQKVAKVERPKPAVRNPFKKLKEKIWYICHKEVKGKVVQDVHPDGVYNTGLAGMKKDKNVETTFDFKDNDRSSTSGAKPVNFAKEFNDYRVSQVSIEMKTLDAPVYKADSIKRILKYSNKSMYINQRNYVDVIPTSAMSGDNLELINIRF